MKKFCKSLLDFKLLINLGVIATLITFLWLFDDRYASAEELKKGLEPIYRSLTSINGQLEKNSKRDEIRWTRNEVRWHQDQIQDFQERSKEEDCGVFRRACHRHLRKIQELREDVNK